MRFDRILSGLIHVEAVRWRYSGGRAAQTRFVDVCVGVEGGTRPAFRCEQPEGLQHSFAEHRGEENVEA